MKSYWLARQEFEMPTNCSTISGDLYYVRGEIHMTTEKLGGKWDPMGS